MQFDHQTGRIVHRYASVPIFDKFDYEKKLENAINHDYLHENIYDHYLFKHTKSPLLDKEKSISVDPAKGLGQQSGWKGTP